ncbi:mas-related G-protein coupled receptor member X1-like [Pogoniulus pusillus]|uniref:mas-related G-protein coupled receptor member X1-like n=1 Tax=Pogoniulus pusillus TaxID=488313 RepID=UPI0030B9A64A
MEKTIITDPSLSNLTYEYADYGEIITDTCFVLLEWKAVAAVCMAISLCGLVGNGLVLWFLGCHMKQNPSATYALYLALADFLLLLLLLLHMLAVWNISLICLNDLVSMYAGFVVAVDTLCDYFVLCSLTFLTAMSVEQCLAVFFPAWYNLHCPKYYSVIVCLVLVALPGLLFYPRRIRFIGPRSYEAAFDGAVIAICTISLSLMLVSNLALLIKSRCGSEGRHPGNIHVTALLSMIFFFALETVSSALVASVNSSIKPVLYFLLGSCRQRRSRRSIEVAFRRLFEDEATREERSQEPGDAVMETSV